MGLTLAYKILSAHSKDELIKGNTIKVKIDQTLTQDATGTMAYLEFISMGIDKVRTELSVSYVDHNTLQSGFMNMDDHEFLQSVANKYGIVFSKAGNGICHQLHLENFAKPGKTLIGSDSHTPTAGAMASFAMGAGGLDVACAMAGREYAIVCPKVVKVNLTGKLRDGVSPKDIIIHLIGLMTVKGGVNKVIEYTGEGVKTLSVPERATITNMGAELGATTSLFPSDERTLEFLKLQNREEDFTPLCADSDAVYDEEYNIDLSTLLPTLSCPDMPDNTKTVDEVAGTKVNQVLIGSCTNSSYYDFIKVASILKGNKVHPNVSLGIAPGSKQVLTMITKSGILEVLLNAGARILESACGPCIGMGQSPCTDGVSLRTFNRNFYGRSGTKSAKLYLVSPEVAAYSAIKGEIANPLGLKVDLFERPTEFIKNDALFIKPKYEGEIKMGPNIKPLPKFEPVGRDITGKVIIKVGDNITTDHIIPGGANVLPYRSNIEKISEFVFYQIDPNFHKDAKECGGGFIVGGANYGQGSSREHAAIAPRYLGIKAVIAESFARIHKKNLMNFGILPIEAKVECDKFDELNVKVLDNFDVIIKNITKNTEVKTHVEMTEEEKTWFNNGGLLNSI